MSFSLILIGVSLALFGYWFRYSCVLILRTRTAEDYALDVCRANGLSFAQVRGAMEAEGSVDLDQVYRALDRDYAIVTQLLEQQSSPGDNNVLEAKLLRANFRVTQTWFRVSRSLGLSQSRVALEEMADTVAYFANSFGELNASSAA
jgi:hypothetical protein